MYNDFIRFLSNGGDKINKTETDKRQRNRKGERERKKARTGGGREKERKRDCFFEAWKEGKTR